MNTLLQVGIVLTAIDKMSGVLTGAADKAAQGFARLQQRVHQVGQAMTEMGTKASLMGHGILAGLETPIKAFVEFENASTRARASFMDATGLVPPEFEKLSAIADRLGVELPGTGADFYQLMGTMKSLGVENQSMLNGTLEAASYLGAVLQVPYAQAGEHVAKFSQALGIAAKDQVQFADTIQRTAFLGVKTEEMQYGFSKLSGTLKSFKMQGLDAANAMAPLLAILIRTGRSGEESGTGLSNIMNQMVNMKNVGKANGMLRQFGIHLDFVDKKTGQLNKDPVAFIAQLEKLNKLNDVVREAAFQKLFGGGGDAQIAKILSTEGVAGYQKMVEDMRKQADLMTRVREIQGTLGSAWEAATGTWTSTLAAFAGSAKEELKDLTKKLNDFADAIGKWTKANPGLSRGMFLAAGAAGVLLVALGGLGIVAGAVASGLAVVGSAVAVLAGPVGVAIAGIAAGATLVITHWDAVAAFFRGLWQGITAGLAPLRSMGSQVAGWFAPLLTIGRVLYYVLLRPFVVLYQWLGRLAAPIMQSAAAAQAFGYRVGRGIAEAIKWVADLYQSLTSFPGKVLAAVGQAVSGGWSATTQAVSRAAAAVGEIGGKILATFLELPGKLFSAGVAIIDQLWAGIQSAAAKLYAGVASVAAKVRAYWPFSPAKEGPLRDLHRVKIIETIAASVNPAPLVRAMGAAAAAGMLALTPLSAAAIPAPVANARPAIPPTIVNRPSIMLTPAVPTLVQAAAIPASVANARPVRPTIVDRLLSLPAPVTPIQARAVVVPPLVANAQPAMPTIVNRLPAMPAPVAPHLAAAAAIPSPVANAKPVPRLVPAAASPAGHGQPGAGPVTVHYAPQITIQGQAGPSSKDDIMAALKQHEHELVRLIQDVMARNARRQY